MKRIVITAANGFIGEELGRFFTKKGFEVIGLVRKIPDKKMGIHYQLWDGRTLDKWRESFEDADAVINLAGKSVNCRYNETNRAEIYRSRLESTRIVGKAIAMCNQAPKVWLNASSATIYAHSLEVPNTEENGIIGSGFSVDVCQRWESEFFNAEANGTRKIALRTAIVLGNSGGVMRPYRNLARFGLGGRAGKGNQQFSWIHIHDLCKAVEFLIDQVALDGVFNICAPFPVRNHEFMASLRKTMHVPFGFPNPKWMLEAGAKLIGTETELLLKSRYVFPQRLLESGFEFDFPQLAQALENLENG